MSDTRPDASDLFEPLATENSARDFGHDVNSPQRCPRFPGSALEKYGGDEETEIESFQGWFKGTRARHTEVKNPVICLGNLSWEFA